MCRLVQLAFNHLISGFDNRLAEFCIQLAKRHIRLSGSALYNPQGAHDGKRLLLPTDLEISKRALRLRAPILVAGNLNLTHCIGFGARFCILAAKYARELFGRGRLQSDRRLSPDLGLADRTYAAFDLEFAIVETLDAGRIALIIFRIVDCTAAPVFLALIKTL